MLISKRNHLKLRDFPDSSLLCSIVGTCLTLKELRQLASKAKLNIKKTMSDYDLHGCFVGIAIDSTTHVHRLLQKRLDSKYKQSIIEFAAEQSEQGLRDIWRRALESADVAGAYYALMTHPGTSRELRIEVFGDIHMLSHLSGASLRIDMQNHHILQQGFKKLKNEYRDIQKTVNEQKKIMQAQHRRLEELESIESEFKSMRTQYITLQGEPANLEAKLVSSAMKLDATTERVTAQLSETLRWKDKAAEAEASLLAEKYNTDLAIEQRTHTETLLSEILGAKVEGQCGLKSPPCANMDLCGQCILYVGGRAGQSQHFRKLVEHCNGQFIYHDGGIEDGDQRLTSILSRADTIMCPIDCISHEAMNKVRRHCAQTTKPLVVMPQSSLSAFTHGLAQIPAS